MGNPAFADWAGKLFGGNYVRAVNNRDIVPRVPPQTDANSYQHFGTVYFYDSQGKPWVNSSWFFRLLDYTMPDHGSKILPNEPAADHAATEYVSLYTKISTAQQV